MIHNFLIGPAISLLWLSCSTTTSKKSTVIELPKSSQIASAHTMIDSIAQALSQNPEIPVLRYDTIDLNYDSYKDLIVYQELTGSSGMLQRAKIFIYNKTSKTYLQDSFLNNIENPSFFMDRKFITAFYIGHGGGYGLKLKWKVNRWDTFELQTYNPAKQLPQWHVEIRTYENSKMTNKWTENHMLPDTNLLPNRW